MIYLYSFLIFIGFTVSSTTLSAIFGKLLSLVYIILAMFLFKNNLEFGIAGLIGSILNIIISAKYINTVGTMSQAPMDGKLASQWYVAIFTLLILLKYVFNLKIEFFQDWYYYCAGIVIWFFFIIFKNKKDNPQSVDEFTESVLSYKIIEKYEDDPKWAAYLYFDDGFEDWNKTKKGSFRAKHPSNDLTFVFNTKEEAQNYASRMFKNAIEILD